MLGINRRKIKVSTGDSPTLAKATFISSILMALSRLASIGKK
jgi:hypothetical protein